MKSHLRRIMVGHVAYVIEINPAFPLTEGWLTNLQNACHDYPAAVIWDDRIVQNRRGYRPQAFRLVWPRPDTLFYPQVDHSGRCAVRGDLVDDDKPGATSRALQKIAEQELSATFSSDILRFTRS